MQDVETPLNPIERALKLFRRMKKRRAHARWENAYECSQLVFWWESSRYDLKTFMAAVEIHGKSRITLQRLQAGLTAAGKPWPALQEDLRNRRVMLEQHNALVLTMSVVPKRPRMKLVQARARPKTQQALTAGV